MNTYISCRSIISQLLCGILFLGMDAGLFPLIMLPVTKISAYIDQAKLFVICSA